MHHMNINDADLFFRELEVLASDPNVLKMKQYQQHRGNATFSHCRSVAEYSFQLAQLLGWDIDEVTLARGAMLHDFHLYSRKESSINAIDHFFHHPKRALENAEQFFSLNEKERNIIESHMWPLTLFTLPRSKEAFLVSLADKYCAICELGGHCLPEPTGYARLRRKLSEVK